jgi:hypothetical protein
MICAASQPCYLPPISFFHKMAMADVFVIADDVRYTTDAAINRAKIKNAQGRLWLTVPVLTKGRVGQLIREVEIDNSQNWREKHWKTLQMNYAYSPYFDLYADDLATIFDAGEHSSSLLKLNLSLIEYVVQSLNLRWKIVRSSSLKIGETGRDWIFGILEATGCDTYLADSKFAGYLSNADFERNDFAVRFIDEPNISYHQQFGLFVPHLSIVDLLFNEGEKALESLGGKVP